MPAADRNIDELKEDLDYLLEEANIAIQREQLYMKNIDEISGENYLWEQEYPSKDAWEQDIIFNHNGLWDVQNEINRIADEYTSDVDELENIRGQDAVPYKNKFLYNYRMEQRGGKKRRELTKGNTNNWYLTELAEKRALSRAVLKIADLYQYQVFSEDENYDDFKPVKEVKEQQGKDIVGDIIDGKAKS